MGDLTDEKRDVLLERLRYIDAELDRIDHWGAYVGALYEERKNVVRELKAYYGIHTSDYTGQPRPSGLQQRQG